MWTTQNNIPNQCWLSIICTEAPSFKIKTMDSYLNAFYLTLGENTVKVGFCEIRGFNHWPDFSALYMLWMIRIRRPRHTCELIRKQWCRLVITSLPSVETCVKRQYLASLKRLSLVWTQASHSYKKMCFRICALEEPWWVQRGHTSQSWNKTGRKRAESWGLSQGTGTEMPWGRGQSWCISPVTTGCPFHLLHFHILAKNTFGCAFFFFFLCF